MLDVRLVAVIPAAGSSTRYRLAAAAADATQSPPEGLAGRADAARAEAGPVEGLGKLGEVLHGKPVLAWAVDAFLDRADVAEVVVVTSVPRSAVQVLGERMADPRLAVVSGGVCRAQSVLCGLRAIRTPAASAAWVAVHDGARPAVSGSLVTAVVQEAVGRGVAAAPALPVRQTVRTAAGPLPSRAGRTVPRETLYAMQTPQVAPRAVLLEALERCPLPLEQVTDELYALELAGVEAYLVPGEEVNIKVTVPDDLAYLRRCWVPRAGAGVA